MDTSKDFMAFRSIGTGSSWGYGATPAEAVFNLIVSMKDWASYYKLSESENIVPVYNVSQYDGFVADYKGVFGSNGDGTYSDNPLEPVKWARFTIPKYTQKRLYSELKAAQAALLAVFGDSYESLSEPRREVA